MPPPELVGSASDACLALRLYGSTLDAIRDLNKSGASECDVFSILIITISFCHGTGQFILLSWQRSEHEQRNLLVLWYYTMWCDNHKSLVVRVHVHISPHKHMEDCMWMYFLICVYTHTHVAYACEHTHVAYACEHMQSFLPSRMFSHASALDDKSA